MKLHFGCGKDIKKDYVNMDRVDFGQEIVRDIRRGIPFTDNTFDEIYSHHSLEHIAQGEELEFALKEFWRVLKLGGRLKVILPHIDGLNAYHSGHVSFWNEMTVACMPPGGWPWKIIHLDRCGDYKTLELHFTLEKTDGKLALNF